MHRRLVGMYVPDNSTLNTSTTLYSDHAINHLFNSSPSTSMGDTSRANVTSPPPSDFIHPTATPEFWIGLFLAISSSIFIGSSFILKKKALLKLATDSGVRAGQGGYGYLKEWMWWAGALTMLLGEVLNFTAYVFAPATLVTPLGSLSVLVTTILSSRLLREKLNLLGKLGCAGCLLGSIVIVVHSPKTENVTTMKELGMKMQDAGFIAYVIFVVVVGVGLIVWVAPKHGQSNILVHITICSVIGSLSVLGCKGIGLAIKETIAGESQLENGLTWLWVVSVVVCVTIQINYLNKALDIFNTAMVTPIYYVFFTSFVIIASGILFKEWDKLGFTDILGNIVGFLIIILGIFQMQLFKDVNVTWKQIRHLVKNKRQANSNMPDADDDNHSEGDHSDSSGIGVGCQASVPLVRVSTAAAARNCNSSLHDVSLSYIDSVSNNSNIDPKIETRRSVDEFKRIT